MPLKFYLTVALVLPFLLLTSCQTFQPREFVKVTDRFEPAIHSELASLFSTPENTPPGQSGNVLLRDGKEAFQVRVAMTELAEETIDAQYFLWNNDQTGRFLINKFRDAAKRGVKIRLLLDGFITQDLNSFFAWVNEQQNIEVRIYNPFLAESNFGRLLNFASDFDRLNRRMHNKSFTVDGITTITGGRNIGDSYFFYSNDVKYLDADVFSIGPVVEQVNKSFNEYWNNALTLSVTDLSFSNISDKERNSITNLLAIENSQLEADTGNRIEFVENLQNMLDWAPTRYIADEPGNIEPLPVDQYKTAATELGRLIDSSEKEVMIESAYLVLNDDAIKYLRKKKQEGVRVRFLTNSMASNNLIINHAGYAKVRKDIIENGIELYEIKPVIDTCLVEHFPEKDCNQEQPITLHTKTAVIDDKYAYVGSLNFNLRSVYLNTESALIIDSEKIANQLKHQAKEYMNLRASWQPIILGDDILWITFHENQLIQSRIEPDTTAFERFGVDVLTKVPGTEFY